MVDTSHGNGEAGGQWFAILTASLSTQIAAGERHLHLRGGQEHLEAGRQDLVPGVPLRHGCLIATSSGLINDRCCEIWPAGCTFPSAGVSRL